MTKKSIRNSKGDESTKPQSKISVPGCNYKQYLKYLRLVYLPYLWSVPFKILKEMYERKFESKLSDYDKRVRLATMVLETSLVMAFDKVENGNSYVFRYKNIKLPASDWTLQNQMEYIITVLASERSLPVLEKISINGTYVEDYNEMFALLCALCSTYTHVLTHVQASMIADNNNNSLQNNTDLSESFKESVDNMHAAVAGINEAVNYYPADVLGQPQTSFQQAAADNSTQSLQNHQNIVHCAKISNFVRFALKAREIYAKHFRHTGISTSVLLANTVFHSLDHYNLGKYFPRDSEEKMHNGIDYRLFTSLFVDLNFDLGHWQKIKHSKCKIWQSVFQELRLVDEELADHVHLFLSV